MRDVRYEGQHGMDHETAAVKAKVTRSLHASSCELVETLFGGTKIPGLPMPPLPMHDQVHNNHGFYCKLLQFLGGCVDWILENIPVKRVVIGCMLLSMWYQIAAPQAIPAQGAHPGEKARCAFGCFQLCSRFLNPKCIVLRTPWTATFVASAQDVCTALTQIYVD